MNSSVLEKCLSSINNSDHERNDSMRKIYEGYIVYVVYFMRKILDEENDIRSYVYRVFDMTFKTCTDRSLSIIEFEYELKKSAINVCDLVLKSKISEYNDNYTSVDYNFIKDIDEVEDIGTNNPMIFSESSKARILNMMRNLPVHERIISLSYYYFELSLQQISNILGLSLDAVENIHKSIKYNIEINLKYILNTTEQVEFSRNIIKMYFFNEQSSLVDTIKKQYIDSELFFEEYAFTKGKQEEQKEIVENKKQDNKKKKNPLLPLMFVIASIVVIIIIMLVYLLLLRKNDNEYYDTTKNNTTNITTNVSINPNSINIIDEEIYLCVGDKYTLNPIVLPNDAINTQLNGMKENSTSDAWYYNISNPSIISFDSDNMIITAKANGNTVFTITSGLYKDENGNYLTDSISIGVVDKIQQFELDDIVVVSVGKTTSFDVKIVPIDAFFNITWECDNENIAKVVNNNVTGLAKGECNIKAQILSINDVGKLELITKEIKVKVIEPLSNDVIVRGNFVEKINEMVVGENYSLDFYCTPSSEYVYLKIVSNDDATFEYDVDTKILTPKQKGTLLIYLYNGLDKTIHLDSFMVNIIEQ